MPENKTPQQLKREREYRKRSAGALAVGTTLAGAGAGANLLADQYLERNNLKRPLRAALKGKLTPKHGVFMAGRTIGRSLQLAGIPMAAAGAYGIHKPQKIAAFDAKRDVQKPLIDALTFKTEAERGRKLLNTVTQSDRFGKSVTAGSLTASEHEELARRKQRAKRLSQISGTLGATALALRAPEAAKVLASKLPKAAPKLKRFAAYEPKATKLSNTLGIGAIGVGSAGSFNFARIQGTEAKAEQRGISKATEREPRSGRDIAAGAALGATGVALAPVRVRLPRDNGASERIATGLKSGSNARVSDLRAVASGSGMRFADRQRVANLALNIKDKGFDPNRPIEVVRHRNGQMSIAAGHHRLEAAERLGLKDVPTRVIESNKKAPSTWSPLILAGREERRIREGRTPRAKQSLKQIKADAARPVPGWQKTANNLKSASEDLFEHNRAVRVGARAGVGLAAVGAGALAYKNRDKIREKLTTRPVSKSDRIIWVNSPEQMEQVLARNPDARVQVRPPKQKSGESKEQRKQRQANNPKPVAPPPAPPVKPSRLHQWSGKKFPGGRLGAGVALVGLGAGLGAGAGYLSKSDSKDNARNAALGAAGAYGAYIGTGYGLSNFANRARKKDKASQKAMLEHRKKMGIGPTGVPGQRYPHKLIDAYNRTMPAEVKYSGLTRVLARTHGPSAIGRMAVPVALAGAAAPLAYDRVKKADDKFLRKYKNNISPSAEQGYKYLKRGRNEAVGLAALHTGVGAWSIMDAAKAIGAKRYGRAALESGLGAAGVYFAGKNAKKAQRWNDKMGKIKSKAVERNKAGVLGRDRQVDIAKAFTRTNPRFGMPYPKGLRRKPAVRDGGIRRMRTGKIITVRGSIG